MDMPFISEDKFKHLFKQGLTSLSDDDSLGAFILLIANATFDKEVYNTLRLTLQKKYQDLQQKYRALFESGIHVNEVDEDLLVFLKMCHIGFDKLKLTEFRNVAEWEFQFNHLRGFRPARVSSEKISEVYSPFTENGFHFNKPFLEKEKMWQGDLGGHDISLFYNKYPFAHYHLLLIPERDQQYPQFLTRKHHKMTWDVIQQATAAIPGIGAGYNSRGAFSSVNHLHFQLYLRPEPLPVESGQWSHNQGVIDYPVDCETFTGYEQSWQFIQSLHEANTAYNLLYTAGKVYVFCRKMQGSYQHSSWTSGFSWYEMAGGVILANRMNFDKLSGQDVTREFSLLTLD